MRIRILLLPLVLLVQTVFCRDFFAVVAQKGTVVRSDPQTVTVTRSSPGGFEVSFSADVSACSYTASIGDPGSTGLDITPGLVFTAGGYLSSKGVYVETTNTGGGLSDYPFQLSVNCTSKYAVVKGDGTLSRGDFDVTGVTKLGTGQYEFTFAVPVDLCSYIATIGDPGDALVNNPGLVFTAGGHSGPNEIYVETKDLNGHLADYPFHLSAACASTQAVVNAAGMLVRGDVTRVSRGGTGQYAIFFAVSVSQCDYTATIGDPGNGAVSNPGYIFTTGDFGAVYVETKNLAGALADFPFHLRVTCPSVFGFTDLHTHPATHLAFGADPKNGVTGALWGKPAHDGGMDLETSSQPENVAEDLGPCPTATFLGFSDGWFTHNTAVGIDFVKAVTDVQIVSKLDDTAPPGWTHEAEGWRSFGSPQKGWPAALSVDHQVMHINSIKRAFDGGLRLMFAAATDDEIISKLWNQGFNLKGNPPPAHLASESFDYNSAVAQLTYITNLVNANSDWMQIVKTPSEARAVI
jgi:hypothetical protein